VTGGTFQMGSESGNSNEKPVHTVTLSDFQISKYEITNAQYCAFLNAVDADPDGSYQDTLRIDINSSYCQISYSSNQFIAKSGKENYPVIMVNWYGARAFCEWVGGRLPTEAEWEYAARGGNQSNGYTYSGSNTADEVAWCYNNSQNPANNLLDGRGTHVVGQKLPNELGLYDMSGNVYEWCNDWYSSDYFNQSPAENPPGPESGNYRVLRGGSWNDIDYILRCAFRGFLDSPVNFYFSVTGLRCVR